MSSETLKAFIDEQVNSYAKRIIEKSDSSDELAVGELFFYTTLRSVLNNKAGKKELGLLDAINDTLQHLGKIESGTTFYK
ncbi:hypothetical protein ACQR3P_11330 [Rhodococcus sp. IEGM1300]